MKDLNGRVAVITGGAAGIGLALAEALGAEGAKLVIADIEERALEGAVNRLQANGYEALGVRTDVARFDQVEALARKTLERFGKVHIVCNNAGVSITGPIWQMSLDDWRWVYDVNVWGVIHGIKAFVPILIEQGEEAHVVNTASLASFNAVGDHAPYCSSKAAAWSMSQALFNEVRAWNTKIGQRRRGAPAMGPRHRPRGGGSSLCPPAVRRAIKRPSDLGRPAEAGFRARRLG